MADSLRRVGAMDAVNGVSQMHRDRPADYLDWPRRLSSGASFAATGLQRRGDGSPRVFSLAFQARAVVLLSIGGKEPSGAAAPTISFLLDRRRL